MKIFDTHCDTITKLYEDKIGLYNNNQHVDIKRMINFDGFIQFFAIWINPKRTKSPLEYFYDLYNNFVLQIKENEAYIEIATDINQAIKTINKGKAAAFISVEGGEVLQGDICNIEILHKLGVRSISLTWNHKNEIATGVEDEEYDEGVTPFGFRVIKEMEKKGIIIDISHLTERCFWDVLNSCSKPIIASHSNSKAVCNHKRNLSDEQFIAVSKLGGVVGINLYSDFLTDKDKSNIADVIKHIEHFMSLGGKNNIGLGADFDGIDKTPCEIKGIQDYDKILETLLRLNYSQEQVNKIAFGNYMNLMMTHYNK